ncbi:MAG: manganese efflux pump MntP family protein [Terracidiphilus sp.]
MSWTALFAIAFSLSLDAFAIATVAGATLGEPSRRQRFRLRFHFGLFQAMMLAGGWYLGSAVSRWLQGFGPWVAFALLALVGGNIVRNALRGEEETGYKVDPTRGWNLVFLSVASSLDALAVGISLAMVNFPVLRSALIVGLVSYGMTLLGMGIGPRIGAIWGRRCELSGGIVLIFIGLYFVWPTLRALCF